MFLRLCFIFIGLFIHLILRSALLVSNRGFDAKSWVKMLYWINKNLENNNVVILSKNGILLASCRRDSFERADELFKKNTSPVSVLGKENITLIPFSKVLRIITQVIEPGIELSVKTSKTTKKIVLNFSDFEAREKCFLYLKKLRGTQPLISSELSFEQNASNKKSSFVHDRKGDRRSGAYSKSDRRNTTRKDSLNLQTSNTSSEFKELDREPFKKRIFIGLGLTSFLLASYFLFFAEPDPASLYDAIQTQTIKSSEIETYLKDGADIDFRGADGITPLLSAINHGKEELVVSLVNNGADLSSDYNGETALDIAIASGLNSAVKSMLDKDAPSSNKNDLLIRAIQNKLNYNTLNKIISLGGNVNYINENGSSVLATALLFGSNNNVIKLLLDQGASTSIKVNGVTPELFAQSRGNQELASLLSSYKN